MNILTFSREIKRHNYDHDVVVKTAKTFNLNTTMENCKPHITLRDSQLRGDNGDTYNKSDSLPKQIYKLRPYMGNDFSVDEKVESYNVDEETLNNFIHRIVLSCALQEAGENGEDRIGK